MSITNRDGLVSALATSLKLTTMKASITGLTAGVLSSLWRATGFPSQAVIPSTATPCTRSTTGAFYLPSTTGTESLYLGKASLSLNLAGNIFIADRLANMGGLNGTLTTAQAVNLDLTQASSEGRCVLDGSDSLWFIEVYTATGATAVTATVTYTNSSGVAGRTTTVSLAGSRPASCFLPIFPNALDNGIRSIQSITLSATTGTVGNFGVTAVRSVAELPVVLSNTGIVADYASLGLPVIKSTSCIMFYILTTSTSTGILMGSLDILRG